MGARAWVYVCVSVCAVCACVCHTSQSVREVGLVYADPVIV